MNHHFQRIFLFFRFALIGSGEGVYVESHLSFDRSVFDIGFSRAVPGLGAGSFHDWNEHEWDEHARDEYGRVDGVAIAVSSRGVGNGLAAGLGAGA
jgi:hypothetical protein